jgi:hypothetical protein
LRETGVDQLVERPGVLDRVHDVGDITNVVGDCGVTIFRRHPAGDDGLLIAPVETVQALD